MDKRVPIVESAGKVFVFGKSFSTLSEAEAFAAATITRREKIAGRSLTAIELQHGVDHHEDRGSRQRMLDEQWRPYTDDPPPPDPNPIRAARERGDLDRRPKRESREAMWSRVEGDFDRQAIREQEAQAFDADPRRQAAVARAEQLLEQVKWTPSQPRSVVVRAEQLLQQAKAKAGRPDAFRQLANDLVGLLNDQKEAKAKEIEARVQELRADKETLWEEPETPPPPPPQPADDRPWTRYDGTVSKTEAEYQEGLRRTAEFDERIGRK